MDPIPKQARLGIVQIMMKKSNRFYDSGLYVQKCAEGMTTGSIFTGEVYRGDNGRLYIQERQLEGVSVGNICIRGGM